MKVAKYIDKAVAISRALSTEREFYDHVKEQNLYPHSGQQKILKQVFKYKKKRLFLQCGRNFGKSHVGAISACLYASLYPNSRCYIVAPWKSQGSEIYWASRLVQTMVPRKFFLSGDSYENKNELRLYYENGSFVKVDGADNEDAVRGIKPHFLVRDEFQAWKKETVDSMEPNLLAHDAICLDIGTPPDRENHFTRDGGKAEKEMKKGNKRYFFTKLPTHENPLISRELLDQIKLDLIARGEEEIWMREYMAEFVPGGASAVFKMFSKAEHVRPIEWIHGRLEKDLHKCHNFTVLDPGSTSVFAAGFFIYNQFTGEVFLVDELYEQDDKLTSTGQIWPRIEAKEARYFGNRPRVRFYDEASAWFLNEVANQFPHNCALCPTNKRQYETRMTNLGDSCSVVKDAFIKRKFFIADHCVHAQEEITNYHKNEFGEIAPRQPDHIVDIIRYFFHESGWRAEKDTIQGLPVNDRAFFTPAEDFRYSSSWEDNFSPQHTNGMEDFELEEGLLWN